jgi:hypothetical protein
MTATVAWRAGALMLAVTGQEERELLPYLGRTFRLKDAEGYSARFEPATGRAERVLFIQPNGVFPARRKK